MIAVLTAGGTVDAAFARAIGTNIKALAPWRGMKLLDPAIQAARACGASHVIVVGNHQVKAYCGTRVDEVLPAVEDGQRNLQNALLSARPDQPLLLLTSDMPFITPDGLRKFLAKVGDSEIAMPLADGSIYQSAYPNAANHVTNLGGERIANGSVFYFSSGAVAQRSVVVAKRLFRARKSLLHMASLLDLPLIARFATRKLTIGHLEEYAQSRFSLRACAIRNISPGLCFDIDSLADYQYAVAYREPE